MSRKALSTLTPMTNIFKQPTPAISKFSTSSKEEPNVLFDEYDNVGVITLNRPKALNSLNLSMVKKIYPKLIQWQNVDKKDLVIIQGAGEKAFCAGGDVVSITKPGKEQGLAIGREFFQSEYKLNDLIGQYRVPYVALIDGYTMGGGVGVSVHGKYRVATERTTFAMPETTIGLFPDVGGAYILSRQPKNLGLYLAMTSYQLRGKDVTKCGIATHFIPSHQLPNIVENLKSNPKQVDKILNENSENLENYEFSLNDKLDIIDECFSAPSVEEIFDRLKEKNTEFTNKTLGTLQKMSPTSLKVTKQQFKFAAGMDLTQCLKMDYRLACSGVNAKSTLDFYEGVRALLIDKDKSPKWNPPTVEEVDDEMVEKCFEGDGTELDVTHG